MQRGLRSAHGDLGVRDYVVRIYRWGGRYPGGLVGLVEEIGAEGRRAFQSLDELWAILESPGRPRAKAKPERRKGGAAVGGGSVVFGDLDGDRDGVRR